MNELEGMIKNLGWEYRVGNNYFLLSCPFAKHTHPSGKDNNPSCIIRPQFNFYRCYSCGMSGDISDLFKSHNEIFNTNIDYEFFDLYVGDLFPQDSQDFDEENYILDDSVLDLFNEMSPEAIQYMKDRGLPLEGIDKYNLRYDANNKNIILPIYTDSGDLLGASGRKIFGRGHLHYFGVLTTKCMGGLQHQKHEKNLIVEGLTDLLNSWKYADELGYNTYCTFTASMSNWQANKLLCNGATNHIAYDQDKAGKKGSEKAAKLLSEDYGLTVYNWQPSDIDMGNIKKEAFYKLFG